MKKALVTGGGGFVGKAIVAELIKRGVEVVAFGRNDYPDVVAMGAKVFCGDIRDKSSLLEASTECDTVFHVAAKAGIWGNYKDYYGINYSGTENVIAACMENKVGSLVYTSTPSVVFNRDDIINGDESLGYPATFLCHYAASKCLAEKKLLAANCEALRTTALRPHLIWGPGDTNLIPRLLERGRQKKLKIVGDGQNMVDISYIDNVVDAHIQAAYSLENNGKACGNAYFISQGEPVNLWQWINSLYARLSIPPVEKTISFKKAYFSGAIMEAVYTLFGIDNEPLMTRFLAEQLAKSHWFSIEKAKSDFGYKPRVSNEEGMAKMVEWLREN